MTRLTQGVVGMHLESSWMQLPRKDKSCRLGRPCSASAGQTLNRFLERSRAWSCLQRASPKRAPGISRLLPAFPLTNLIDGLHVKIGLLKLLDVSSSHRSSVPCHQIAIKSQAFVAFLVTGS